jgi:polyphenol oxidase
MSYKYNMKIFYPFVFRNDDRVTALFTESNRRLINPDGEVPGLNLGYNTEAGKEEVDQNFNELLSLPELDLSRLAVANQVHGSRIRVISKPGLYDGIDGMITTCKNLALGIRVADCAAVLIADPVNGVAGAFHAGWKGAAGRIVSKGVMAMAEQGAEPALMKVYISPCISYKNFEVGEEVASQFPDRFTDRENFTKPHVDLKGFILSELLASGVETDQIEVSTDCTMESDQYYSYRREGEQAGRMLGLIQLRDESV